MIVVDVRDVYGGVLEMFHTYRISIPDGSCRVSFWIMLVCSDIYV